MQRQAATIQHPGSSIGNQTASTVFKSASKQHPWSWDSNHLQPVLKQQPPFLKQQPLTRAATNSASSCKAFKLAATSGIKEFQIRAAERHQVQEDLERRTAASNRSGGAALQVGHRWLVLGAGAGLQASCVQGQAEDVRRLDVRAGGCWAQVGRALAEALGRPGGAAGAVAGRRGAAGAAAGLGAQLRLLQA
ncbi:hypothetical protein J5N97_006245 [Dioscorea zingiberensis]|uniref:Uncharacterized protein n=1 Tax=Dioscorea zingiberensis TaxID=325984 RepID=A0A9D5HT67_9LILI|nr:hypothetical protein J5N97_006245 [Dioscorea zingiberensis]